MCSVLFAKIQLNPFTTVVISSERTTLVYMHTRSSPIKIKRNGVCSDRRFENVFELVVSDCTRIISGKEDRQSKGKNNTEYILDFGVHIKILESYPVVCIRPLQNSLKHYEIIPGDEASLCRVRYAKQRGKLRPSYFSQIRLGRDRVHELLGVEEPGHIGWHIASKSQVLKSEMYLRTFHRL